MHPWCKRAMLYFKEILTNSYTLENAWVKMGSLYSKDSYHCHISGFSRQTDRQFLLLLSLEQAKLRENKQDTILFLPISIRSILNQMQPCWNISELQIWCWEINLA